MAEAIIRIKVDGATGKGWLVDEKGDPLFTVPPPPPEKCETEITTPRELTPGEHRRVYEANGFKLVGSLYHSHSSPGCLYWIGNTPVILPCP
jgi:hypothetical protein